MTDLPYIIGSYVLVAIAGVGLAIFTSLRLGRAKARLKAVDKRAESRRESL
jgi:hypothetical protein